MIKEILHKKLIWKVLLIGIFFSCSGLTIWYLIHAKEVVVKNSSPTNTSDSLFLEPTTTKVILLDSLTAPEPIHFYQFFAESPVNKYITFFNSEAKAIYFYDFNTGALKKSIQLGSYGFNHSDKILGYYLINHDSLFVYNYSLLDITLLSITKGKIMKRTISDNNQASMKVVYPYVGTSSPIGFDEQRAEVYLVGFMGDEGSSYEIDKDRNVLATFNMTSAAVNYSTPYPEFYWGKNWGGTGGFRQPFCDYNKDSHLVVVSFMADHNITILDTKTRKTRKSYAGSKYFDEIKSMKYTPMYFDFIKEAEIYEYYSKNPSYTSIIYDKYRKVYYRIAELPVKNFDPLASKRSIKQKSIIILDSSFTKVGEVLLPPHAFDCGNFFVSEEGLYLKKLNDKIDDRIIFQLFQLRNYRSKNEPVITYNGAYLLEKKKI
jgi:hypothetical protein